MDRKEFFKTCAYACLSGVAVVTVLQSCKASKIVNAVIEGSGFYVDLAEFESVKKGQLSYRKYILVHNENLKFPICIYRISEQEYSAVNLQCSHQGAELQVFGDKMVCPAHGSEFNAKGGVENGPAVSSLRTFPTQIENKKLKISLL